jgi:hypothetical protein
MISTFNFYKGEDFIGDQPKPLTKNTYHMHKTANEKRTVSPAHHHCLTKNNLYTQPAINLAIHNSHLPSGSLAPVGETA